VTATAIPEITPLARSTAERLLRAALDNDPAGMVHHAAALTDHGQAGVLALATVARGALHTTAPPEDWHMLPPLVTDLTRGLVCRDITNRQAAANPLA
jgi:hypothetical protein